MGYSDEAARKEVLEHAEALAPPETSKDARSKVTESPPPVRDGGKRAWLQVVGSFLVFCNLWGFIFASGTLQSYYELTYLPDVSPSAIAWITTLQAFLLVSLGVVSGPLFDLGYYRSMLVGGSLLQTLGAFLLSLCKEYYQIFLAQGLCMGLGCGMIYLPGLALVSRSFVKHRALALGIVTCGAPVGGTIFAVICSQLIQTAGFAWTVRVIAFIMLGTYLVAFPLLLWGASNFGDIGSGTARKLFDKSAFKDIPFWLYTFANFFIFAGYMIPFFFIPGYAQAELQTSRPVSFYILISAQVASILGRLIAAVCAKKYGVMIPWIVCAFSSSAITLGWIGVRNVGGLYAIAALYGGLSGALVPLPPSVFPIVCPDPKVIGTRMGMAQVMGAVASLVSGPIAGAAIHIRPDGSRSYLGMQLYGGIIMGIGGGILVALWLVLMKKRKDLGLGWRI